MTTPLEREIARRRDERWRRRRDRRLRTPAQARAFVRQLGFCLFWPSAGIELPNLLHAIAGNVRPLTAGYDDPAVGRSWNWKDEALDRRWWYYGKLLRRRATLVSLELLPAFYALSENYGDPRDYLVEYQEGRLSAEAKAVYEALLENGPLDTVRLRKEARLSASGAKARFDRALVDLQAALKVLPVGVADAGAWHYAFVYELVDRWFPELPERARGLTTRQARGEVLVRLVDNLIAVRPGEAGRTLGWSAGDTGRAVTRALEEGRLIRIETDGPPRSLLTTPRWKSKLAAAARRTTRARGSPSTSASLSARPRRKSSAGSGSA